MTGDNGTRDLPLERSAATEVTFAPHATTTLDFALVKAGAPVVTRPDLGIGADDVAVKGRKVSVTVHSLGARPAEGGTVSLIGADGATLASASVPPLAAPTDLTPRTATVSLTLPAGAAGDGASVRVALPDNAPEVTMLNNGVPLSRPSGR
jgi:hypothetical protein